MMVNKYILIVVTLIFTFITNYIFKMSFLKGGIITIGLVTLGYILYMNIKQRKRYSILEEKLDPEKFIEETHKAYRYAGKNKELNSLLNMDLAFAYMSLGEYNKTMEFLDKVDPKQLPKTNNSLVGYYTSLMIVYYNLDDCDKAREMYKEASKYPLKNKRAEHLRAILDANKYFYEGDYEASRRLFSSYPKDKMSKRFELEILYVLACIDEKERNCQSANLKYKKVAKEANGLYIGKLSKDKLKADYSS